MFQSKAPEGPLGPRGATGNRSRAQGSDVVACFIADRRLRTFRRFGGSASNLPKRLPGPARPAELAEAGCAGLGRPWQTSAGVGRPRQASAGLGMPLWPLAGLLRPPETSRGVRRDAAKKCSESLPWASPGLGDLWGSLRASGGALWRTLGLRCGSRFGLEPAAAVPQYDVSLNHSMR